MVQIGVIIPALNPDDELIKLIKILNKELTLNSIIKYIIIVDDGSDIKNQ